jgi:hypothetical protein
VVFVVSLQSKQQKKVVCGDHFRMSVRPSLYDLLSAILMQFGIELLYGELSSNSEFGENRFVDSGA